MRRLNTWCVALFLSLLGWSNSQAAISGLQRVADELVAPMYITHAPGDRDRLFIGERGGAIRILDLNTGDLQATPFLSMTGLSTNGEGGFLGLAFHPDYDNPEADGFHKFYVKVTTPGSAHTVQIREYEVSESDPNLADPGSLRQVLSYTNPQGNHVGGWIGFSPNNKYLYIANGDGGGGFDGGDGSSGHTPGTGNAQDITNNVLGKILRIDPLDPDGMGAATYSVPSTNPMVAGVGDPSDDVGDDVIWAYGLRNPFRASFDRITGDLWIGDVGQNQREEIDFEAASSAGGLNYGWRYREGFAQTAGVGLPYDSDWTQPVYDYNRDLDQFGGTVVTGGYVYRGPDPSLQGKYFFLDSRNSSETTNDNYWTFDPDDPFGTVENIDSLLDLDTGSAEFPVSFGEDAVGNLYIAYIGSGEVFRIRTDQLLSGDYNADGEVNSDDEARWRQMFGMAGANLAADGNKDGVVNVADYVVWRKHDGTSVHSGSSGGQAPEPAVGLLVATALVAVASSRLPRSIALL
jgi:glucose/arabinose dehydrogenase